MNDIEATAHNTFNLSYQMQCIFVRDSHQRVPIFFPKDGEKNFSRRLRNFRLSDIYFSAHLTNRDVGSHYLISFLKQFSSFLSLRRIRMSEYKELRRKEVKLPTSRYNAA